jgi:hypothetical protein
MMSASVVRTHGEQQNNRQRHTQHPEKYSASHDLYSSVPPVENHEKLWARE